MLKRLQGKVGVPKLHWVGIQGDFCVLVIEPLGANIESLFNKCNRKFSVQCIFSIAQQVVLIYIIFSSLFLNISIPKA